MGVVVEGGGEVVGVVEVEGGRVGIVETSNRIRIRNRIFLFVVASTATYPVGMGYSHSILGFVLYIC